MSSSTISKIINDANLSADNIPQAQSLLDKFSNLPPHEKETHRASISSEAFCLFFGQNAIIKGEDAYETHRQAEWSANCWLKPQVIVLPDSAQQVATVLSLVCFFNFTFSIRGGGHLSNPRFTSNDGGVVISLAALDHIELAEDKSIARIGAELRWLDVYKALDPHGLAVAGGRTPTVGVSGLLLGGGLSYQNGRYGVGAAGVVNYEVVLGNSEVVNANMHENSDLFWALKGGGPNFGIVTKMDMETVPTTTWSMLKVYPPTHTKEIQAALMRYHEAIEKDNKSCLIWFSANDYTILLYFYSESVEHPAVFDMFRDIPHISYFIEPGLRTTYELTKTVIDILPEGPKWHEFRTMTNMPSLEVYEAIETARMEQANALRDIEGLYLTTVIQPLSSHAITQSGRNGGTPLGLEPVGQQWFLVMADWTYEEDEDRVRQAARYIVNAAEEAARKAGKLFPYRYSNYSSRDQDPLASYGVENIERMKSVAAKYDPDGVFQKLQNDGWLLSKVGGV
ncbi:FAD-binding domain-containing protein [Aspergillus avenaceus]|uniref:FAD-binding domain-containing protein n=1 Tax=Aspergillus avenaceus TaxID=36643 RepID=A0A5N6TSX7_ASPAV|nr:FAD-binding domain-containing protein [Aspergillus avenaceus]